MIKMMCRSSDMCLSGLTPAKITSVHEMEVSMVTTGAMLKGASALLCFPAAFTPPPIHHLKKIRNPTAMIHRAN